MTVEDRELMVRERSLVVPGSGSLALALMSDEEFEARLQQVVKAQERSVRIKQALMKEGVDYGVIPGTGDKPTLLLPGAQKLCLAFRLVPTFDLSIRYGDGETSPQISVDARCYLHLSDAEGQVIAQGVGNANSWERRYRYRKEGRTCPVCGGIGTVIKGKEEYGGGWLCWKKNGGCGSKFPDGAVEIEQQQVGEVENPDPFDLLNTLEKMSKKRSLIDATLTATGMAGEFTQDLEDMADMADAGDRGRSPVRARSGGSGRANGQAANATKQQPAKAGGQGGSQPVTKEQKAGEIIKWFQRTAAKDSKKVLDRGQFNVKVATAKQALYGAGFDDDLIRALAVALTGNESLADFSDAEILLLVSNLDRTDSLRCVAEVQLEAIRAEAEMMADYEDALAAVGRDAADEAQSVGF